MTNRIKICSILVFFLFSFPMLILSDPLVPCLFFFGDDIFDNGNNNNLLTNYKATSPPYGIDFPGGATGRFSNGKNLADYIALELGFTNYIQPYATVRYTDITRGVNYASGGAGLLGATNIQHLQVISMEQQVSQHEIAISIITALQRNASFTKEYLEKCFYTVAIGSNEIVIGMAPPDYGAFLDEAAIRLVQQLSILYNLGARRIAVFPVGKLGCIPLATVPVEDDYDDDKKRFEAGCDEEINSWVDFFNEVLEGYIQSSNLPKQLKQFIFSNPVAFSPPPNGTNEACCQETTQLRQTRSRGLCVPNQPLCNNRQQFFDGIHPFSEANVVAAKQVAAYVKSGASNFQIPRV